MLDVKLMMMVARCRNNIIPTMLLFIICYALSLLGSVSGSFFFMSSHEKTYTRNAGDTVILSCQFSIEWFHLFNNPVLWKKTQGAEVTYVNLLGNINKPFVLTNRFEVSFTPTPPSYLLELSIANIAVEDSGNYTCEIRGEQSQVLGNVTHHIYVRDPVKKLYFTSSRNSTATERPRRSSLTIIQGQEKRIGCVARGGYPMPDMLVYIGSEIVTQNFTRRVTSVRSGVRGFRVMSYVVERWSSDLRVLPRHDGKQLQCVVTVPGLSANVTKLKMKVKYKPVVHCFSTKTHLDDDNVSLRCEVKAKPSVTSLYWTIDANGTRLSEGDGVIDQYWTMMLDIGDNAWETRLFTKKAELPRFRTYSVTAENAVGVTTNDVALIRGYRDWELQQNTRTPHTQLSNHNGYMFRHVNSSAPVRLASSLSVILLLLWCICLTR